MAANNIAITYSAYIIRIINKREGFTAISVNYSRVHVNYIIYYYNIRSRRKVQCVLIDWRAYVLCMYDDVLYYYTRVVVGTTGIILLSYTIFILPTHGEKNNI